jgi:hypothetical protein
VHLSKEPRAQGNVPQAQQAGFDGPGIVDDLFDIRAQGLIARFGVEDLDQRRPGSLDARRGDRFSPQVGTDEQMRVRKEAASAGEPSERRFGVGEPLEVLRRELDRPGDRAGEVRDLAVATGRTASTTEGRVGVPGCVHPRTLLGP